jgi:transcriptional regulator with XRE-family HTH domain
LGSDVRKPQAQEPKTEGPSSARLVSQIRSELGVTREFFARMTGFSVRAISGWESGRPVSEPALRRIKEMRRLRDALAEGIRPEFIPRWLETPCEGLGGLKPVEVLERGETDRLWRTVFLIGSGMPT